MEYIKWRSEAVEKTIALVRSKKHYLDNRTAAEFCLLQLRFCCELLAVGCVAIHTDIARGARLQSEWNAESIMKQFDTLKPAFFPTPVKSVQQPDGSFDQVSISGALTKAELLKMYGLFGRLLHTGSYKSYKKARTETFDFSLLVNFLSKLKRLLNEHTYLLHEEDLMIRVIMHNEKDGRVLLQELRAVRTPT
ncbi:MAG: hypothetical protein KF822_06095 [Steroidobacteraceae bacterium]|nr:hypothetical protein [Steroidobacteraceae bacterium]